MVAIVFISGLTLGNIPFNIIQLLWINLIMDILAAISLGTEPIVERTNVQEHEKETRISRQSKIFEKQMWRNIVIQTVYQVTVILCLMYFGIFIFVDSYNLVMAEV